MFGGVQILKAVAALVRGKLSAILLGTAGMGLNAVFHNIGELVFSATNMGLPFSSTRAVSAMYSGESDSAVTDLVATIRSWAVLTALGSALLCLIGAWGLDWYFFSTSGHSHVWEIMLLSIYVMSLPLEAAECAILKGARQLKSVASVETLSAFGTIICTAPFFYLWGIRGVAVSLVACGWMTVAVHMAYSVRIFPYRIFTASMHHTIHEGLALLRVGIPYVLAALMTAICTSLIYRIISTESEIGLYKAAYSIIVTYAGMAFVAIDNDYFPRLTATGSNLADRNYTINQQIRVCSMLAGVLMSALVITMPWVIRILLSEDFLPAVPMATAGAYYVFMRSVNLPLGYVPLARGDSRIFLCMETVTGIITVVFTYVGYRWWGLSGCGIALSASGILETLLLVLSYSIYYKIRFEKTTVKYIAAMITMLSLAILIN